MSIGPASVTASGIERSLKARGDHVVLSDDIRHALLLTRIFSPDSIVSPGALSDASLALLLASTSRPLIIVLDEVDERTAMGLLRQGVARVVPLRGGPAMLAAVLDAPLLSDNYTSPSTTTTSPHPFEA